MRLRLLADLLLELPEQQVARLWRRHAGDAFDLGELGLAEFVDLGAGGFLLLLLLRERGFPPFERVYLAIEVLFPVGNTLLKPQDFVAARLGLLFGLSPDLNGLLFRAEEDLLFLCLRIAQDLRRRPGSASSS